MSATLDPRPHAYRPDLAAVSLRGKVEAARYVEGEPRQVARASAAVAAATGLRGSPRERAAVR